MLCILLQLLVFLVSLFPVQHAPVVCILVLQFYSHAVGNMRMIIHHKLYVCLCCFQISEFQSCHYDERQKIVLGQLITTK